MVITGDIGGTNLRLALYKAGELYEFQKLPLQDSYPGNLEAIRRQLEIWKKDGKIQEEIERAGFAITGALDPGGQKLINSVNLSDWQGQELLQDLQQICGCRVRLANDTYCAALSEAQNWHDPFWYVNWGTGIGGCLVYNAGDVRPAEIGHMCLDINGIKCRCGQKGCWDSLVSGKALELKYEKPVKELSEKEWYTAMDLFVYGLINLYVSCPVNIVLNGGIMLAEQDKLPVIREIFNDRLKILPQQHQIFLAKYGDKAGIYGAYRLGF